MAMISSTTVLKATLLLTLSVACAAGSNSTATNSSSSNVLDHISTFENNQALESDFGSIIFTGLRNGKCYLVGYYDDSALTNNTIVNSCFSDLGTVLDAMSLEESVFINTYYYDNNFPYCTVICTTNKGSGAERMLPNGRTAIFSLAATVIAVALLSPRHLW